LREPNPVSAIAAMFASESLSFAKIQNVFEMRPCGVLANDKQSAGQSNTHVGMQRKSLCLFGVVARNLDLIREYWC
jgi:hypothetical protein